MIGLILASFSVGLSNFAASIGVGISGVDKKTLIRVAIIFGFFEGIMPVLGLLIGQTAAGPIAGFGKYIGAGLLILIGLYGLLKTHPAEDKKIKADIDIKQLVLLGFVLSFDNLIVGFALSLYHVSIVITAILIAVISTGMSLLGLEIGKYLGKKFAKWSEQFGAIVLIGVGIIFLLGYV